MDRHIECGGAEQPGRFDVLTFSDLAVEIERYFSSLCLSGSGTPRARAPATSALTASYKLGIIGGSTTGARLKHTRRMRPARAGLPSQVES